MPYLVIEAHDAVPVRDQQSIHLANGREWTPLNVDRPVVSKCVSAVKNTVMPGP